MRQNLPSPKSSGELRTSRRRFVSFASAVALTVAAATASAQVGVFDEGLPGGVLDPRPGLNWGRFNFHGGITGTVAYDDLVEADRNGDAEDDVTWVVSPFASVETEGPNARSIRAYYRPGLRFFTEHSDLNTVDHNGLLDLRWPLNRLSLSLAQNVDVSSVVIRDIANRARQLRFGTIGRADYELSDRTSLQLSLTYDRYGYSGEVSGAQNLIDSQQFGQQLFADYHWTSKISTGMGASFSQLDVEDAPLQTSEGPEWRVNYTPTANLTLSANVGVQFRQFDSDRSGTVEPVMRIKGSYSPRPGTVLGLEAHRAEFASGLQANQNFIETGVMGTVNQVLFRRFTGTLAAGYNFADYLATTEGVQAERSDSYYMVRTAIDWHITGNWSSGIFYEHTANSSDQGGFEYDHNIVGLRAGWSF